MSLTHSFSESPFSGLLGGELLSASLGQSLGSESSHTSLLGQASRNPLGAVIETAPPVELRI